MNRRSLFALLFGSVAAPVVAKAVSASPVKPYIDPYKAAFPELFPADFPGFISVSGSRSIHSAVMPLPYRGSTLDELAEMGISPPLGWEFQWRPTSDVVRLAIDGWCPVPAKQFDGMFMPPGHSGPITGVGYTLCERPLVFSQVEAADTAKKASCA